MAMCIAYRRAVGAGLFTVTKCTETSGLDLYHDKRDKARQLLLCRACADESKILDLVRVGDDD